MKIVHLTPGTGNFHCGSCHRDNHLVKALRRLGHEVVMVPLYLPLVTDGPPASGEAPMFVGGINLFLQQKSALLRKLPRLLERMLDAPRLLLAAVNFAHMTSPRDLGAMTVASFQGLQGPQAKEWQRLLTWMAEVEKPDLVSLSNGLLNGLAPTLQRELGIPVVCSLQGEDSFLDALPEPYRTKSWELFRENSRHVARYIATSEWYGNQMRRRLALTDGHLAVVHNGLDLSAYAPATILPAQPTIGFLSRLIAGKGLGDLVTAFLQLKANGAHPRARLALGGTMTNGDLPFIKLQKRRIADAGLNEQVSWHPNLSAEEKIQFLQSLTLLSVPATYGEAFGLYVLEALACGVPVVEPNHAGLAEIVTATGGGVLYDHTHPHGLANALVSLLENPAEASRLADAGRDKVLTDFTADAMARRFAEALPPLSCPPPALTSSSISSSSFGG